MAAWYCGSTKWAAIAQWAASTAYVVGDIVRQLATPSNFNERAFRCTTAGTSGASEPSWNLGVGATTNDGTAVWTEVTGNETYAWTAAARQLKFLYDSRAAAGDTIYVSNNHAYSVNAVNSWALPGSAGNFVKTICVDDSAAPPTTPASSAVETVTVTSTNLITGFGYLEGVTLIAGDGADNGSIRLGTTSPGFVKAKNCSFRLGGTSNSANLSIGTTSAAVDDWGVEWENVTVSFASTGQSMSIKCPFRWSNTPSALLGTIPFDLFTHGADTGPYSVSEFVGVDFSASSHNLVETSNICFSTYNFIDCKLGSATISADAVAGPGGIVVRAINCDSADTNYRYYLKKYQGEISQETTIVRTGGASDGTTPISRKMVSTANNQDILPLKSDPIEFWNESLSSITVTIEIITDNVTLKDNEAWIEVEYLGDASFPRSVMISDGLAHLLATPVDQTSSSVTWTTTGLTTPVKQKLEVTFTPLNKGPIRIRVCYAKKSSTMYFCPKPVVA